MNLRLSSPAVERFPLPRSCRALAALALLLLLGGCGRDTDAAATNSASLPAARVVVATAGESRRHLRLPARAEAGMHVLVYARATGMVAERRVDIGDTVTTGQVLAVIHAPEVDQAARAAEAERRRAQTNLNLARTAHRRANSLIEARAISQEEHDERVAAFEIASANLAAAEARLANLREQQGFQAVRSLIDGTVTARNIERGDRVIADQGAASLPLFELSAIDTLRVVVDVPQDTVARIARGQSARVGFAGIAETEAKIARLAERVAHTTGGMRIELNLPNPDHTVRPGMVGWVSFTLEQSAPVVLVPVSSLVQDGATTQVVRITPGDTAEFRPVRLGRNLGGQVEILEGISKGDRVMLAPNARVKPGDRINILTGAGSHQSHPEAPSRQPEYK